MSLIIIIPALNEAKTIAEVVKASKYFGDVLVIDDFSTDMTGVIAEDAGAIVLKNKERLGYDGALNEGYIYAKSQGYRYFLTFDADGQLPHDDIPNFITAFDQTSAFVVGTRAEFPRISEKLFAGICSKIIGLKDPFCGMKAYDLSYCTDIYKMDRYNSLGTDLCIRLIEKNYNFKSIEIKVSERKGVSRLGGRLKSEIRVFRAAAIGCVRIIIIFLKRKFTKQTLDH